MNVLWWVNLAATFALFASVSWALYETHHPGKAALDRANWLLWSLVHLGIALACLQLLLNQLDRPTVPPVHILVLKVCLAVRLLVPWNRRSPA